MVGLIVDDLDVKNANEGRTRRREWSLPFYYIFRQCHHHLSFSHTGGSPPPYLSTRFPSSTMGHTCFPLLKLFTNELKSSGVSRIIK